MNIIGQGTGLTTSSSDNTVTIQDGLLQTTNNNDSLSKSSSGGNSNMNSTGNKNSNTSGNTGGQSNSLSSSGTDAIMNTGIVSPSAVDPSLKNANINYNSNVNTNVNNNVNENKNINANTNANDNSNGNKSSNENTEANDNEDSKSPFISEHFWVDINGNPGNDFIVLKGFNNLFISCDCEGNLKTVVQSDSISKSQLWIPENSSDKFAFRSYYGGYLTIDSNNSVNCISRLVKENQIFKIISTGGPNNELIGASPKYMKLQGVNNKLIGIDEFKKVVTIDNWINNRELFTGNE
jgi:hypothetical protein